MLYNKSLQLDISNLFKAIANFQITQENLKQNINQNPLFSIEKVIVNIDCDNNKIIQAEDIKKFMCIHRFAITERELQFLINQNWQQKTNLSKNYDAMTYQELQQFLQPLNYQNRNEILLNDNKKFLVDVMEKTFSDRRAAQIIQAEIINYRTLEKLKKQIYQKHLNLDWIKIFQQISNNNKIDFKSFRNFFERNEISFNNDEFIGIQMKIKNTSQYINYEQFMDLVTPQEPYYFPEENKIKKEQVVEILLEKCKEKDFDLIIPAVYESDHVRYKSYYKENFHPFKYGQNEYIKDINYTQQQFEYQDLLFKPSRDFNYIHNENDIGSRNHDNYFNNFYKHLYETEELEEFFNKFGKRYIYDQECTSKKQVYFNARKEMEEFKNFEFVKYISELNKTDKFSDRLQQHLKQRNQNDYYNINSPNGSINGFDL